MNKVWVIMLVFSIVLISGCDDDPPIKEDYFVGFDGLSVSFVEGHPPEKIYSTKADYVAFDIENKGAFPPYPEQLQGKIYMGGYNLNLIDLNPREVQLPGTLYGKSDSHPLGTQHRATIDVSTKKEFVNEVHETTFIGHICYIYQTNAFPMICIKEDAAKEKDICDVERVVLESGQGAPIAVTKINEIIGGDSIYFDIYVKNYGEGTPFLPNEMESCPNKLVAYKNANIVNVKTSIAELGEGDCTPHNIILEEDEGYTTCKFKKPEDRSAYTMPLNIILDYGYYDSLLKEVQFVNR